MENNWESVFQAFQLLLTLILLAFLSTVELLKQPGEVTAWPSNER